MLDLRSVWSNVSDQKAWSSRRATFMAKLGATKAVWFPPEPSGTAKKAAKGTKRTTKKAAKKTSRTTKRTTKRPAKKTALAR